MSKVFKTLIITAPVMALIFFYTVVKQHEMASRIELESARFDTEFAHLMREGPSGSFNESFWVEREKKSQELEKEKEEELKKQKEKVQKFEEEFEKSLNDTEAK